MTPRTRTTNKEANFKVYYSKKPPKKPQQRYFPSRRKIVRHKPGHAALDVDMNGRGGGERQLVFKPEMMRRGTVQDSEEEHEGDEVEEDMEGEEDVQHGVIKIEGMVKEEPRTQPMPRRGTDEVEVEAPVRRGRKRNSEFIKQEHEEEEEEPVQATRKAASKKGKKRNSDILQQEEEEDEEPVQSARKRRRTPAKENMRELAIADNDEGSEQEARSRLRRQSTMTQLVGGRKPTPGSREPEFKPLRRNSGKGKGSKKESAKDRKQRTLTQMVPGLGSFGAISDDEEEEEEAPEDEESRAYQDQMAEHLRAVFELADQQEKRPGTAQATPQHRGLSVDAEEGSTRHLPEKPESHEEDTDVEASADYEPTQDVQAPILNTRRTSKRLSSTLAPPSTSAKTKTRKSAKTRFSLLSTPERRKVKVIPSSQSPPDSSLSTQSASPIRSARRPPLGVRSGNSDRLLDTPSKLRKVTFKEPDKPSLAPPTLRKFESTIPDSEGEEEEWSEDEIRLASGKRIGVDAQALFRGIKRAVPAADVGAETQAVLQQIDLACANAEEDAESHSREHSEETEVPLSGGSREVSQELGEEPAVDIFEDKSHAPEEDSDIIEEDADIVDMEANFVEDKKSHPEPEVEAPRSSPPLIQPEPVHKEDLTAVHLYPKPDTQELLHGEDVSMFPTQAGSALQELANEEDIVTESAPPELPFPATQYFDRESQPINEVSDTSLPVQNTLTVDWNEPHEDLPSTPMVINDSDEEEESSPTPRRLPSKFSATTPSSIHHSMTDLDGESIQVPRSPNPAGESQRSCTSHSSKAEKQIQNEWQSHTQYFRNRAPQSSSMYGIQDGFSYQATPLPNKREMAPPQSTAAALFSQATTVDCTQSSPHTTPKKIVSRSQFHASPRKTPSKGQSHYQKSPLTTPKRTPHKSTAHFHSLISAHTTPHRPTSNLQDFVSPVRPPPLVIPSSCSSPGRAGMQWSSPLTRSSPSLGMETQSAEEFSMPPLPPMIVESSDFEDEEL
jgi:hypothetical protein